MRIVTNPGANVSPKYLARYPLDLMPINVSVSGKVEQLGDGTTFAQVDDWIARSQDHPTVIGTSAAEFVELFRKIAERDREILVLCGSRKIIGSFVAAQSAARIVAAMARYEDLRIEVVDFRMTDIAVGLCVVMAGEAARMGLSLEQTATLVRAFADQGHLTMVAMDLDRLVKGGRASFVRAWLANVLDVYPLLGFRDGELSALAKVPRASDLGVVLADALVDRVGAGRAVWAAVTYANAPREVEQARKRLHERLAIVHYEERPFAPTSYLQTARAIGGAVFPVDALPFAAPIPPRSL